MSGRQVTSQGTNSKGNSYTSYSDGGYYYNNSANNGGSYYRTGGDHAFYNNSDKGYSFHEKPSGERSYRYK